MSPDLGGAAPRFALDTSALLAMMQTAPGGSVVGAKLHYSAISTVNLAEVLDYSQEHGIEIDGMVDDLQALGLRIEAFLPEDASAVAAMAAAFRLSKEPNPPVLSVSDRACLCLARRLGVPALTADYAWSKLELDVKIQVLR